MPHFLFSFPSTISSNQFQFLQRPRRNKLLGRALTVQRQSACLLGRVIHPRGAHIPCAWLSDNRGVTRGEGYQVQGGHWGCPLNFPSHPLLPLQGTRYKGPSRLTPPNRYHMSPALFVCSDLNGASTCISSSFSATLPLCHSYFLLTRTPFLCTYTALSWLFWSY